MLFTDWLSVDSEMKTPGQTASRIWGRDSARGRRSTSRLSSS